MHGNTKIKIENLNLNTYIMNQQINIYKYIQSHIIVLHQHVSVTLVTVIRVSYNIKFSIQIIVQSV